jgi:hypothetical protein
MNTAKIVDEYSGKEELVQQQKTNASNKEKASFAASMLEMIRSLKGNNSFKSFIKLVVDPEKKAMRSILDDSKDLIELYRAQGSTKSLKKIFDLDKMEKYWAELHRKYDQRSKPNNNNKEL